MCASLYQTRHRQKKAARSRFIKSSFLIVLFLVSGGIGFRFGARDVIANESALKGRIRDLEQQSTGLTEQLTAIKEQNNILDRQLVTARTDYQRDVPVGPAKELSVLLQKKLDEQVPSTRLAEIITKAESEKKCKSAIVKRFQPATGERLTDSASISFEDGAIKITGTGEKAKDDNNNPVSWFDPTKPVNIDIITDNGQEVKLQGLLPLDNQWVHDKTEYHLTFSESIRSFVQARIERCHFP
jgi:hypothetical protein